MDENKLKKLKEIGYSIPACCGLCKHGVFRPNNDFGDCSVQTYEHKKHSADSKQLSVVKYGSCPRFEADPRKSVFLHAYSQFMVPSSNG